MANDRLLLVHRELKVCIVLGKHMGWGWYQAPSTERLQAFYDYVAAHADNQEDLLLFRECEAEKLKYGEVIDADESVSHPIRKIDWIVSRRLL